MFFLFSPFTLPRNGRFTLDKLTKRKAISILRQPRSYLPADNAERLRWWFRLPFLSRDMTSHRYDPWQESTTVSTWLFAVRFVILLQSGLAILIHTNIGWDSTAAVQLTYWWNYSAVAALLLVMCPGTCCFPLRRVGGFLLVMLRPVAGAIVVVFWVFTISSWIKAMATDHYGAVYIPGTECHPLKHGEIRLDPGWRCLCSVLLSLVHHLIVPTLVWVDFLLSDLPYGHWAMLGTWLFCSLYVLTVVLSTFLWNLNPYPDTADFHHAKSWGFLPLGIMILLWQNWLTWRSHSTKHS
jgi:hypothetical protein